MSCRYEVKVRFVDTTYWDEGSRWTSQTFKFSKRKEALAFAREASAKGCTVNGQNGPLSLHPREKEDVDVERISRSKVEWVPLKENDA